MNGNIPIYYNNVTVAKRSSFNIFVFNVIKIEGWDGVNAFYWAWVTITTGDFLSSLFFLSISQQ